MKKSKKILTIVLSFALLTAGVQSYNTSKADSYNVPSISQITSEVKTKDERIINAIKNLEDAKARNIDAYNRALQRLENKPTASDKVVLEKSKALIKKANAQIIKLKNYQKIEKPEEKPTDPKPEVKTETKVVKETIPFNTIKKHNIPGAQTKISQQGKNGERVYNVTYVNGKEKDRKLISTSNPVNQVILTYVKTQDAKYETRWKDQYFLRGIPRDIVENVMTDEEYDNIGKDPSIGAKYLQIKYFDTYEEIAEFLRVNKWEFANYGTADPVSYQVKVQDELWQWQ